MQDKYHLYFLFDLMGGGDLMDVLVAEAKVIKRRIPQGAWRRACFAPKVCLRTSVGKLARGTRNNSARPAPDTAARFEILSIRMVSLLTAGSCDVSWPLRGLAW
jgi:hypothetical protein